MPELAAAAIYKYVDARGVVNYSTHPRAGAKVLDTGAGAPSDNGRRRSLGSSLGAAGSLRRARAPAPQPADRNVRLATEHGPDGDRLVVRNDLFAPVQVRIGLSGLENVASLPNHSIQSVVAPRSRVAVLTLRPNKTGRPMHYQPKLSYSLGDPRLLPRPYRYPHPWLGGPFRQTQGPMGRFSHNTPRSRYAVDISMPKGTPIVAARGGVVIKTVNDQYEGGANPAGNYVRILHDDGTMGVYLHLSRGSLRVREGQRVAAGERLASSGNTGHSTGAHLHFVVQRNMGFAVESIPFSFARPVNGKAALAVGGE